MEREKREMVVVWIGILLSWGIIMLISILTMIHGWGIEPRNWSWIIGGQVFGVLTGAGIQTLAKIVNASMED